MNKKRRNQKGFTMVELVIVIAIMGIIGAVLVPSFSTMSAKAKLTTDISTVKTLKRTIDVYQAEMGSWPSATNLASLNSTLISDGYLQANAVLKISGADISYDQSTGKVKLSASAISTDAQLSKAYNALEPSTKTDWIN